MMKRTVISRLLLVTALLVGAGCTSVSRVRTTPSVGVDRIPATVAVYPLLSSSEAPRAHGGWGPIKSTLESREEIYLTPPTESELLVTASSQMLTGEMSTEMMRYGFDLREMPYEMRESNDSGGDKVFVVSLALLDELREQHGLKAVIIGNAYFEKKHYRNNEIRVVAAYLKVIDTETLEVLCQVTMSYDAYGRELNEVAHTLAYELAGIAGLSYQ